MAASSSPRFSIVVCTRNPREPYFRRVLQAISELTGAASRELVVVDSNSTPPLAERDIPWPANTRIVREEIAGVGRARMAGIRAAVGEWIVFVDDDNVLDFDYLERADEIIRQRPEVVLFCGRISAEFEAPPPGWLHHFRRQLAIIDVPEDSWADHWNPAKLPCWTAGMCVRHDIVGDYCAEAQSDPFLLSMTRVEDVSLVMRTVAKKNVVGLFRALHLTHLIPQERMTAGYLSCIAYETGFNMFVIHWRSHGLSWRDFLRPVKNALMATIKHGLGPRGRIARAAAYGDFRGAVHCLLNPPPRGNCRA